MPKKAPAIPKSVDEQLEIIKRGTVEIIQNGESRTVPLQSNASGVGIVDLDAIGR